MSDDNTDKVKPIFTPFLYRVIMVSIGIYFILRLLYFAFVFPHQVPPDEVTHVERISVFQRALFLPGEDDFSADEAHLRISQHAPYLYYVIASKWVSLNVLPISDLFFLRLLSIFFSCLTIFYGWKCISRLSENQLVHIVFMVLITNTLMFNVMSASASYDALTNLCATMMVYYFVKFRQERSPDSLVCLFLSVSLGGLVKITLIPLAFIVLVSLAVMEFKHIKQLKTHTVQGLKQLSKWCKVCAAITLFLTLLNGMLYGGNLVRFGHLTPKVDQLLSEEEIMTNPVYARNAIYLEFLQGKYTLEESLERADRITRPEGVFDTKNLVQFAAQKREEGIVFEPESRIAYAHPWYRIMLRSTYGILGHTIVVPSFTALIPFSIVFVATILCLGWVFVRRQLPSFEIAMIVFIAFYALLLMQLINYPAYMKFQLVHIAVQGRYMFPVLVPIYALIAKYLLISPSRAVQIVVSCLLIGLYIYSDFIFFMFNW